MHSLFKMGKHLLQFQNWFRKSNVVIVPLCSLIDGLEELGRFIYLKYAFLHTFHKQINTCLKGLINTNILSETFYFPDMPIEKNMMGRKDTRLLVT
jgi:hypothetical protein